MAMEPKWWYHTNGYLYPFEISLHRLPNFKWMYSQMTYDIHIDWTNYEVRFKTEEDKVQFILRWS